jgi:hypothetical protein
MVSKITILGLKMIMKSGLEKIILKSYEQILDRNTYVHICIATGCFSVSLSTW